MTRLISKQVPLALKLDNEAIFESFWSDADPIAVASVRDLSQGSAGWIYLAGSQGGGVSHLLQACSAEALKAGFSAMYVDFLALLEIFEKSVPFGKKSRINALVFSFVPRSQGECG